MPRDLIDTDLRIIVLDRTGARLPYSRNETEPLLGPQRHVDHLGSIRAIQHHVAVQTERTGIDAVEANTAADLTQRIVDHITTSAIGHAA